MPTDSRRNLLIRLFGLLIIASLFTLCLMFVRVQDVQGIRVPRKQTQKDVKMATTSSVRKIHERRKDLVESQQRMRSSSSPFARGDSHIRNVRKQANRLKPEGDSLAPVKKSRVSVKRRVFTDKRSHRIVHQVRNTSAVNTPIDAPNFSKNSRLVIDEAFGDKNASMPRDVTKSGTVASGAGTALRNLSSAMLGSFKGVAHRPDQNPLESKRGVTVITKKPGSTPWWNGSSSAVPKYSLGYNTSAKLTTVQIGKQLEADGSRTSTLANNSKATSTLQENFSVIGDSLRVANAEQKTLNQRTEGGRVDKSKTEIANVKKPEPTPRNNPQVVRDASRMTVAGAEKKTSASLPVSLLGLGRVVAGVRREPVEQKLAEVDDTATPGDVTSSRINLIIVAQPRTGSSFLGDAFNQHPDVFYLFEPLHGIVNSPLQHLKDPKPMQFLAGMLRCKFSQLTYVKEIENFRRFSSNALSSPPLCTNRKVFGTTRKKCHFLSTRNMEIVCKSNYNVTVMKLLTPRIPNGAVNSLFPLCNSTNCSIIYLVRDPRPVVFSHIKVGMQSWQNFKILGANETAPRPSIKMYSARFCRQIEANIKTFKNLTGWMKSRYHMLRYEDLAGNPTETLRRLYKMAGLTMVNRTLEWIELHTTGRGNSSKSNYSTKRNSKAIVDNWRLEIDPCVVNIIEHTCRSVMQLLGYKALNGSEQMQYNLNVSLTDGQ